MLFLEHRANPNAEDGWIFEVKMRSTSPDVVKLLMDHGAKPSADANVIGECCRANIICAAYIGDSELLAQCLASASNQGFYRNNTLRTALWLAVYRPKAPAILRIMQRWGMMQWKSHVHLGPAFENGKN